MIIKLKAQGICIQFLKFKNKIKINLISLEGIQTLIKMYLMPNNFFLKKSLLTIITTCNPPNGNWGYEQKRNEFETWKHKIKT